MNVIACFGDDRTKLVTMCASLFLEQMSVGRYRGHKGGELSPHLNVKPDT